jgi:zinc protease
MSYRLALTLCGFFAASFLSLRSVGAADYAVVVSQATKSDPAWSAVVEALVAKHDGAEVVVWQENVGESLDRLRETHPRYACFVATPSEAGREFVADVHRLTRKFDDDPYADAFWGIVTGYDAEAALSIAKTNEPLTVKKAASGTAIALDMCRQGVWYDELVKNKKVSKAADGKIVESKGPSDTTAALAAELTDQSADLFVTSGHATERDWQIGFAYRNGAFQSKAGKMFGVPTSGEPFEILSDSPKVYLAVGNCLMGHIDGPDAMALAWMKSVGVRQMIGYTVVTWYGYAGWGTLDYFVEQPGRYTLAEAFLANQHALIHRLDTSFEGIVDAQFPVGDFNLPTAKPTESGKALGLTENDARGLLWDRDTLAFYGDPAWIAKMEERPKAYGQTLTVEGDLYTLTIKPNRGKASFEPIDANGSQRGYRPIVAFLPRRIGEAKIVEGADLSPIVTDDFLLVPNPRVCDPDREYRVTFEAQPVSAASK